MIVQIQRGFVRVRVGDRTAYISGEAFLPGHGSPDFLAYANAVSWEPPHDGQPVTEADKQQIFAELLAGAVARNLNIEIE